MGGKKKGWNRGKECIGWSLPYGYMKEVDLEKDFIRIILKTGIRYQIKPLIDIDNVYQIILSGMTTLPFYRQCVLERAGCQSYDCLA